MTITERSSPQRLEADSRDVTLTGPSSELTQSGQNRGPGAVTAPHGAGEI
jgi:hypothetical protein